MRQQCVDAVLMVRPKAFGYNPDTAATNTFQKDDGAAPDEVQALASEEFAQLARAHSRRGGRGVRRGRLGESRKPDAIFPNNWLSFHADGTLVLYPLQGANRRAERRQEVIDAAVKTLDFRVTHLIDLTHHEGEGRFLEGTGSLVLDHVQRAAYACASPRTHPELVAESKPPQAAR